jgi:hypothetical protein
VIRAQVTRSVCKQLGTRAQQYDYLFKAECAVVYVQLGHRGNFKQVNLESTVTKTQLFVSNLLKRSKSFQYSNLHYRLRNWRLRLNQDDIARSVIVPSAISMHRKWIDRDDLNWSVLRWFAIRCVPITAANRKNDVRYLTAILFVMSRFQALRRLSIFPYTGVPVFYMLH